MAVNKTNTHMAQNKKIQRASFLLEKDNNDNVINPNFNKEIFKHCKDLLFVNSNPIDVFMPNEIFKDLNTCSDFRNWNERALAYTSYYLFCYMYRNAIYSKTFDLSSCSVISLRKNVLGITGNLLNRVIKKNGIMDKLGYTISERDYPIHAINIDDGSNGSSGSNGLSGLGGFETYQGLKEDKQYKDVLIPVPSAFYTKFPVKAFYRYGNDPKEKHLYDEGDYDGHFFTLDGTHHICLEAFIACMSNSSLGYKGFYLYGFLRHNTDKYHSTGFKQSLEQLSKATGINHRTITKYHKELKAMGLLHVTANYNAGNTYTAKKHPNEIFF